MWRLRSSVSGQKPCSGPHCRHSVKGRLRFCPAHWRALPVAMRQALAEASASQAWHIYQQLAIDAAEWLRTRDAARIAAVNAATARILGERAD